MFKEMQTEHKHASLSILFTLSAAAAAVAAAATTAVITTIASAVSS